LVFPAYRSKSILRSFTASQKIMNLMSLASELFFSIVFGRVDSRFVAHRFSLVRIRIDGCRIGMAWYGNSMKSQGHRNEEDDEGLTQNFEHRLRYLR
jgi:hypothetical protein